jgi:hypothetical protein
MKTPGEEYLHAGRESERLDQPLQLLLFGFRLTVQIRSNLYQWDRAQL